MKQTCNDGVVIPFGLPAGVQVVRGGCELFQNKESAQRLQKIAHKRRPVFCEQEVGSPVWYDSMAEED